MENINAYINQYIENKRKKNLTLITLVLIMLLLMILSLNIGSYEIGVFDIIKSVFRINSDSTINLVIWNLRMPRVIAAVLVGAGLSIAGCVMQNNLNNPLASPSTLGISSAATFGANFAIIFLGAGTLVSTMSDSITISNPYLVAISAFIFSMISVLLILGLSKLRSFSTQTIILFGVALSSLFTSGVMILQYFAEESQVSQAVFWTFGDLSRISWNEILLLFIIFSICFIYFNIKRWNYNSLNTDEDIAKSLGVNLERTRFFGLLSAALVTAISVSFVGTISFIGLLAPHIMRRIVGNDYIYLIPSSAFLGGILLLIADILARLVMNPLILPVGAITALLGAPLFLYILMRKERW